MPRYLELEVSIKGTKPRVWRRFLIRSTDSFDGLHNAIQDAFGWYNCHPWEFRTPGRRGDAIAGLPTDDDFGWGEEAPDAAQVRLSSYFKQGIGKCNYLYDFGDGWEHDVLVRKRVDLKEDFERRLLAGRKAGPPEDCGGSGVMRAWLSWSEPATTPWAMKTWTRPWSGLVTGIQTAST